MSAERWYWGQHRAGQRGHGVGDAETHRDGEGGVDGRRTDHVRVIAGSADGQAQPSAEERDEQRADHNGDKRRHDELIGCALAKNALCSGKDCFGFQHGHVGGEAHDRKVDRVQPRVGDDARQNRRHSELCLQKRGDKARRHTGQHGQRQPQERVAATAAVADTAQPSVNAPSVVISAMFRTRKLKNSAIATSA